MNSSAPNPADSTGSSPPPAPLHSGPPLKCLDSAELFDHRREINIRHGSELYRLRLTKSGKLILHK